jgi:HlyD family secretion protein
MLKITRRQIVYGAAALAAALLVIWMIFDTSAVSVETAVSKVGPMIETVDAEARTRVRDKQTVTAPITGKMSRIRLLEGDYLPHEYVITQIDPNPPMPRLPDEPNRQPGAYAAKVYSPANGKILRIFEKNDRVVTAGTPILEIGTPENIELVVDVLSTDALRISPGNEILIEDPLGQTIKARVKIVESQAITKISALGVEEQRVNVIGDFLLKDLRYGDNFRVDVRIVVWEGENVLTVPSSALFRNGEEWNIFVVESGRAKRRTVNVGHQNNESAEITGGLAEGERVILHPPNQLTDGSRVKQE